MWLVKKLGYDNLKLDQFEVEISIFMPTKRAFDLDNYCGGSCKFIFDSLVESGMIINDDYRHLIKLTAFGNYDKDNPRTEFLIRTVED